jgi:hypothetical protein
MKRKSNVLCGVLCIVLLLLGTKQALAQANAKPPTQLTYQGFLTDANGVPFGNTAPVNKTVIFRIYDALTGGTPKWSSQQVITVDKGYFSALLGQGSAVGSEPFSADLTGVFSGSTASDRYLELNADGTTVAPRLRFLAAPYALLSKSATELVDPVTGASSLSIAGGVISGNGAGLTSLNGASIATGTISESRLPNLSAAGLVVNSATTATSANTANAIVARDGSGSFTAGTITATTFSGSGASLTGIPNSATTATSANTANAIVARDASGNISVGAAVLTGDFRMKNDTVFYAKNFAGVDEPFIWPRWIDNCTYLNYGSSGFYIRNNNSTPVMFMGNNGFVGIGTTGPPWPLTVETTAANDGNAYMVIRQSNGNFAALGRSGGSLILTLNNAGNGGRYISYDGDANLDFPSDRRLKKDIVDAEPVLDRAMQVQVRRFRWKESDANAKHMIGVIAQELQPLFPEMVKELENPHTKEKNLTVTSGDFAVIAIKALQEFKQKHDVEVTKLKAELAELALENQELQAGNRERDKRLAAIEQFIAGQSGTVAVQTSSLRDGR